MATFEEEYDKLNAEQRAAVDAIEGPVLVIAGPGTGKTQLLTLRVANILKQTDAAPENILCLTFTNKAANNMRERLLKLAGPASLKVVVKTFHSFAAEIMNQYPDFFWSGARLVTVPDAVQLEILQQVLDTLPLRSPLARKFAGEYTAINDVQEALKLTKEAGLTPDKLSALVQANMAYIDIIEPVLVDVLDKPLSLKRIPEIQSAIDALPTQALEPYTTPLVSLDSVIQESLHSAINADEGSGKTKQLGRWKQRWIQGFDGKKGMFNERKRNAWWGEIAKVYTGYRKLLHQRGYYDYADMLVEVISQIEQHEDMQGEVQEQFQYVLIDEFQDTNAAQLRLAHLVADHYASNGRPNLMVVGDDDQSIFKFNGAELNNMLNFRQFYKVEKPIVLTKNYRSSQAVLDIAQQVAALANDRLVTREQNIDKQLNAVNAPKVKGAIEHTRFPTQEHQLTAIVDDISSRIDAATSIAVLARGHESLRQLASLLLDAGIDVRYEQRTNVLEHEAVVQVYLLAKIIVAIQQGDRNQVNALLPELLQHPMWHIDAKTLWTLAVRNRSQPDWLAGLQHHPNRALQHFADWLQWLATHTNIYPLPLMIDYLLGLRGTKQFTSPIKQYFVSEQKVSNTYLTGLSALRVLRQLTDEFVLHTPAKIADFVRFVDISKDNHRIIADTSPFITASHAVDLMTVHKAKGLEFDIVYIIDANEENWRPRTGGRKPPANLPLQPYGEDMDDYVRLMYVAVTRAKHSIIVSSYALDGLGNERLATPLISNIFKERVVNTFSANEQQRIVEQTSRWPILETTKQRQLLRPVLESYQLTASAVLDFLDVKHAGPEYFRRRHLLRLPEIKTVNQAYGTAMHSALETGQLLVNTASFSLDKVKKAFRQALFTEHLDSEEYERYALHGEETLDQLFDTYHYELPKGSQPEQSLTDVVINGVRLSGTLDRIDVLDDSSIVITDYKTGKSLPTLTTKNQTLAVKAWRHRTQLIFYTLLARHSGRFTNAKSILGQIVYAEAETKKEVTHTYQATEEDLSRMVQLITAIWQHVQRVDMPDINSYSPDITGIMQFEQDLLQ